LSKIPLLFAGRTDLRPAIEAGLRRGKPAYEPYGSAIYGGDEQSFLVRIFMKPLVLKIVFDHQFSGEDA
jgi:hypothetical protein